MIPSRKECRWLHDFEDAKVEGEDSSLQPPSSLIYPRGDERPPRERLDHCWWRGNLTHDIYSIKET